jgi:hypothetical protein
VKKLLGILVLGLLLYGCATPVGHNYSLQNQNKYVAVTNMWPEGFTDNFIGGFTLGMVVPKLYDFYAYSDNRSDAIRQSEEKCRKFAISKGWTNKVTCEFRYAQLTSQPTYSSSSSSSSYSSSSTSKPKPRLYYDSFSGGMRECAHDASATGKCLSFKPYNASLFDKDTLFYNPNTGAMQPCLGVVTVAGKCTSYAMFNHGKATADKGQLFYDPKNKKMTTCSFVTLSGKCTMYDLVPNKWSKNPGVFKEPGSDISFPEPGSDISFPEPGSDISFPEPGSDISFPEPGSNIF